MTEAEIAEGYQTRLFERCSEWEIKKPAEAAELRRVVLASLHRTGKPMPAEGSLVWQCMEEAVREAIRIKNNWPSERQWIRNNP